MNIVSMLIPFAQANSAMCLHASAKNAVLMARTSGGSVAMELCLRSGGHIASVGAGNISRAARLVFDCLGPNAEAWVVEEAIGSGLCTILKVGASSSSPATLIRGPCEEHLHVLCELISPIVLSAKDESGFWRNPLTYTGLGTCKILLAHL